MKHNKADFSQSLHYDHLKIINGVSFTPKEIDVIACLLGGRTTKTIAQILFVKEKTVETHKYNVMRKLEGNSKESIINFIEKSAHFSNIKKHYLRLLDNALFEKKIQEISKLLNKERIVCSFVYWQEEKNTESLVASLKKHLELVGIKISLEVRESYKTLNSLIQAVDTQGADCIIYVIPQSLLKEFQASKIKENLELFPFIQKSNQKPGSVLFLLSIADSALEIPLEIQNVGYVNVETQKNYYFYVLEILKKIIPHKNMDKIVSDFKNQVEIRHKSFDSLIIPLGIEAPSISLQDRAPKSSFFHFSKKGIRGVFVGGILLLCSYGLFLTFNADKISPTFQLNSVGSRGIRSDLPIPTGDTLLRRTKLLEQMENKFKEQNGVKIVALTGVGGAGKTTLARQYATDQKVPVLWEINAETHNTLFRSLQNLAFALAKTPEDKNEISLIQQVANRSVQEGQFQLLFFIKQRLKENSSWLLIYDNVENLASIKNFLPSDRHVWGTGKVIITTKDLNTEDTSYIEAKNVINIEELEAKEALTLFTQIYYNMCPNKLPHSQQKEASSFLKQIPAFPLDISIAAYYIRNTHIPFKQYLKELHLNTETFTKHQEYFLEKGNHYTKARYSIVKFSLEKIIRDQPTYKELALLICLLESQHIPRSFLESYEDKLTADSFIYQLKKNGLLFQLSPTTFALHRSTQAMGLAFLKTYFSAQEKNAFAHKLIKTFQSFEEMRKDVKSFYDYYNKITIHHDERLLLAPHLPTLIDHLDSLSLPVDLMVKTKEHLWLVSGAIHKSCTHNMLLARHFLEKLFSTGYTTLSIPPNIAAILLLILGAAEVDLGAPEKGIEYFKKGLFLCKSIEGTEILQAEILKMLGVAYGEQETLTKSNQYFAQATKLLDPLDNALTKESLSEIYAQQAFSYSKQHIIPEVGEIIKKYMQQSLELLHATHNLVKAQEKNPVLLTHYVAKQKWRKGQVYNRLSLYQDSLISLKDALYIIDNVPWSDHLLKAEINLNRGEALLRLGEVRAAEKSLTDSLKVFERALGPTAPCTWHAKVYRAEAYLRLAKLDLAYADCMGILNSKIIKNTPLSQLLYGVCLYHAAVIAYKQKRYLESEKHFQEFFRNIGPYCQKYLTKESFALLNSQNALAMDGAKKGDFRICFEKSLRILTAIYGNNHPFVQNYVALNTPPS